MKVKDLGTAASKLMTNGAAGSNNYKSGVQANTSWQTNTSNAAPNWATGVQTAASNGKFAAGVTKAGQSKWQSNSVSKGQSRFQTAMTSPSTGSNWQSGFQPYATALQAIQQGPRGVAGSPGNYQIVQQIGDALHNLKVKGA